MRGRIRIISASYRRSDIKIEIFGRSDAGESVTLLTGGFLPYFDVVEPREEELNGIRKNPEYVRDEEKNLLVEGVEKKVYRIFIKHPYEVPNLRKLFISKVMAADIPFHHRFIYDLDLGSCIEFDGNEADPEERKKYGTDKVIECKMEDIKTTEAFNPPVKILSFDIENAFPETQDETYGKILMIGYCISMGEKIEQGCLLGDEKKILKDFNELVFKNDPDILIGYNIDGYDLPVIEYRMNLYRMMLQIGRDNSPGRRINGQFWRAKGRIISDVWWNVKKYLHPKNETLNYVSHMLLNEGKDDIDRLKIEEEFRNRPEEVAKYCMKDAFLTYRIMEKMRVVDRNMFMATVTRLPLEDTTNGGTSNYVDSLLIRLADRRGIAVPMTASQALKDSPIEGGHVESIGAGIYNMVVVLDFKSMYPSMIIKYNICFSTLSEDGEIVSPTGARFISPDKRRGLIPELLMSLMAERDRVKKIMKSSSGDQREYYDGIQNAIKILMNTFYGVLASAFYRFTNPELGKSVTAFARNTIVGLIEDLKKRKIRVIYGDTDSVFIESGKSSIKEAVDFGNSLSSEISRNLQVTIEFEKIMDPFFSHGAKKRYVGKIVYPEFDKGELLVRGYEVRRTDSFDLQSEALQKVFEYLMDRNIDGAREYGENIVKKLLSGDSAIDISKLVISRSVKSDKDYANAESLANVRAARKLKEYGERFIPGMKVSWIVTNSSVVPQEVEPFIDVERFKGMPDWRYYAERVQETLNRVFESLGDPIDIVPKKGSQKKQNVKGNMSLDAFL
ncbi:DNA-directed DNA polymerase [Caldiplasma sukawensis]